MSGLTGKRISDAYKSILRVDDDVNGIDTTAETVTDGLGTKSALQLADDQMVIRPQNDDTTSAFQVKAKGGTALLSVDTTNSLVKAGANSINVLTQYAHFHMNSAWWAGVPDDTWSPLAFGSSNNAMFLPNMGTGDDPATSFTTADTNNQRASELVPFLMYIPDAISIDAVYSLEGADAATGDTTRLKIMRYDFASGSTSALSAGVVAATGPDEVNAGSEQAYLNTWSINNADVSAGKVLMCFLKSDSINSDYSVTVTIKYHIV